MGFAIYFLLLLYVYIDYTVGTEYHSRLIYEVFAENLYDFYEASS